MRVKQQHPNITQTQMIFWSIVSSKTTGTDTEATMLDLEVIISGQERATDGLGIPIGLEAARSLWWGTRMMWMEEGIM